MQTAPTIRTEAFDRYMAERERIQRQLAEMSDEEREEYEQREYDKAYREDPPQTWKA